jgi:hypothetical protein
MLSAMPRPRQRHLLAVTITAVTVTAVAVLSTACSSTTSGSGGGSTATGGSAPTSTHSASPAPSSAFNSGPSTAPISPAPGTPATRPPVHPAPATPVRTVTAKGVDGSTYVIEVWAQNSVTDCAAHAYGTPVIKYLKAHPCYGLERTLATTTVNGRGVGISACSLGFKGATAGQSYATAGAFQQLVTKDGTGAPNDLLREGYRLPSGPTSVPQPDAFDALGQDNGVTVFDAWYLNGATPYNDKALVTMEQNVFLQY